jgi:hypothetical protein
MKYTKRRLVPTALVACLFAAPGAQAQSMTSCTAFTAPPEAPIAATFTGSRAVALLATMDLGRSGVQAVWVFRLSQDEVQVFALEPGFMCNYGIRPWLAITTAIAKANLGADL